MKKIKAFSLIELLISLIIISVIIASFVPIMAKKLSKGSMGISANKTKADCPADKYGANCQMCDSAKCLLRLCTTNCAGNQYRDENDCSCKNCTVFGVNCISCSNTQCLKIATEAQEVECQAGEYKSGSACIPCTAFHPKCSKCNATEGCTECAEGYTPINGRCNKKVTKNDCETKFGAFWDQFNKICITKRNMGYSADGSLADKYREIPIPAEAGVSSVKVTAKCPQPIDNNTSKCCWYGTTGTDGVHTAANASDLTAKNGTVAVSPAYTYSTYKRTVCNWVAAKSICQTYGGGGAAGFWRLPLQEESEKWKENFTSISKGLGSDGLQMCESLNSNKGSPRCGSRDDQCKYTVLNTNYNGNTDCMPWMIWNDGIKDSAYASMVWLQSDGELRVGRYFHKHGASVRCVIDNFPSD